MPAGARWTGASSWTSLREAAAEADSEPHDTTRAVPGRNPAARAVTGRAQLGPYWP